MFKFHSVPAANLPQKQSRTQSPELSLDEKFNEYRKKVWRSENRKLREFHFVAIEHEGFLVVINGERKIFGKIEINGDKHRAIIKARAEIYVKAIKGNEETEGGCYFDY